MTLPLSLSRIWGKKFKKFKKGRKKGKEIRNVLNFTYRVHKRLCFLLPEKRPPHFLSTPLPYANPNLNPTHRGENRLTKSLQTCHHHAWNNFRLPKIRNISPFSKQILGLSSIFIYTRTYTIDLKNSKSACEERKRISDPSFWETTEGEEGNKGLREEARERDNTV